MTRRSFKVVDVTEILVHWYAGRTLSEIARGLGVDRKTIRKYIAPAVGAGMVPGGPEVAQEQWAAWVREWFPELVRPEARSDVFTEIAGFHERIAEGLTTNTLSTVWQRLRDGEGLRASLTSMRRYVRAALPELVKPTAVTVFKEDPPPGDEAQIDYEYLGPWENPLTGKHHRVWGFLMVLAHSRHLFLRPVLAMTLAVWIECHIAAFEFFGGVPSRLVVDNLRAGVLKPDLYDPKLNRTYAELAAHYGALVDPARAGHPKDKPRVERMVPFARDSFFRGSAFASYDQMVGDATQWSVSVAGHRACRPLAGLQPFDVFLSREQEALLPLPRQAFAMVDWVTPMVAPDCRASVLGALYTVPWQHIGQQLDARATAKTVEFFHNAQLVKTWVRGPKGSNNVDWSDYPPDKIAFLQRTPAWCRRRAAEAGPWVAAVVNDMLSVNVLHRLRAAQGILRLGERYGNERLDAACELALGAGDPKYKTIKGVLESGYDRAGREQPPTVANVPAYLHGRDRLFEEVGR